MGLQERPLQLQLLRDLPDVPVLLPDQPDRNVLLLHVPDRAGLLFAALLPRTHALWHFPQAVLLRDVLATDDELRGEGHGASHREPRDRCETASRDR